MVGDLYCFRIDETIINITLIDSLKKFELQFTAGRCIESLALVRAYTSLDFVLLEETIALLCYT